MSTMLLTVSFGAHSAPSKPHKRNLFLRIVDAVAESNRRRAERELAAFWVRCGSQFSDGASS
jgi:hypothetical protein